mgnify:CR=1 FL=1|jgi:hypothetical protein
MALRRKRRDIAGKGKVRKSKEKQLYSSEDGKLAKAKEKIKMGARVNTINVILKLRDQFAEQSKFYRELIQNSIDSGTDRIELDFIPEFKLTGKNLKNYFSLIGFDNEISSSVKELKVDESGISNELEEILGRNYTQRLFEKKYVMGKGLDRYKTAIENFSGIEIKGDQSLIDKFGFSKNVFESLTPMEQVEYHDAIVQINTPRLRDENLRKNLDGDWWNELLDQRYDHLRSVSEDVNQEYNNPNSTLDKDELLKNKEHLEKLLSETKEEYKKRKIDAHNFLRKKPKTSDITYASTHINWAKPVKNRLFDILEMAKIDLKIVQRDYGEGMTHSDRNNFLKKIFSSSKIDDVDQIGRFGVGFLSVFAMDTERVVVESNKFGEAWEYHFLSHNLRDDEPSLPGELYEPETPLKKGTKITLALDNIDFEEYQKIKNEAIDAIIHDCKHVEIPISIDGIKINQSFDLPHRYKVRFGKRGTEGVIALVKSGNGKYRLENNRIRLEEKDVSLDRNQKVGQFDYEVLVSSKYINYDISREFVVRDANFNNIVRLCYNQLDNLALEVFGDLEKTYSLNKKRQFITGTEKEDWETTLVAWSFADFYIDGKINSSFGKKPKKNAKFYRKLKSKINDEILRTVVCETIEGEEKTLEEFIELAQKSNGKQLHLAEKSTEVTDYLTSKGKTVISEKGMTSRRKQFLQKIVLFNKVYDTQSKYSEVIELNDGEDQFFEEFKRRFKKSPLNRYYDTVEAHNLMSNSAFSDMTRYSKAANFYPDRTERKFKQLGGSRIREAFSFLENVENTRYGRPPVLVLNLSHNYIQSLIEHEEIFKDGSSYARLFSAVAGSFSDGASVMGKYLCREEKKRLKRITKGNHIQNYKRI